MIQDIAPHRMDNQYRPDAVPQENSPILIFTGSRTENVMAHVSEGHMRYPLYREMPEGITYTYLFSIDETGYFMGIVSKEAENLLPGELQEVPLRDLRPHYYLGEENRHLIFAAYTAMQLAGWYKDNRYCGTCAHMTAPSQTERALVCPNCGRTIYPRILPAVIIGVTDGDRILMILREHPAFYQLVIEDNGKCSSPIKETGIGLKNMQDRVSSVGGQISFSPSENGFRIFASVPKEKL